MKSVKMRKWRTVLAILVCICVPALSAVWRHAADDQQADSVSADAQKSDDAQYVYLTFDDGPSDNTRRILGVLDRYGVKATFFVTGRKDAESIALYQEIADAGHELAMHSFSHDYAEIYADTESFSEDLDKIWRLLTEVTGRTPVLYRFPGGSSNTLSVRQQPMQAFIDVLEEQGITYFDWNVDTTDGLGANRSVEVLMAAVKETLGNSDTNVILMHDASDHDTTVDALPEIIRYCIDQGYEFGVLTSDTPLVQHIIL